MKVTKNLRRWPANGGDLGILRAGAVPTSGYCEPAPSDSPLHPSVLSLHLQLELPTSEDYQRTVTGRSSAKVAPGTLQCTGGMRAEGTTVMAP